MTSNTFTVTDNTGLPPPAVGTRINYNSTTGDLWVDTAADHNLVYQSASSRIDLDQLCTRLDELEQRMNILQFNQDLEEKWKQLRELGDNYRTLEQELLAQEKTFDILKK